MGNMLQKLLPSGLKETPRRTSSGLIPKNLTELGDKPLSKLIQR